MARSRKSSKLYKDGTVAASGMVVGGRRHGAWKYFFRTGKVWASGRFAAGKMVGPWKWFHKKTGKLAGTGSFDANKQIGAWKRYDLRGRLVGVKQFVDGKRVRGKAKSTTKSAAKKKA